jgi:hypothetical protein
MPPQVRILPFAPMKIKCDRCGDKIKTAAALVFSPPKDRQVNKFHICCECWVELVFWVQGVDTKVLIGKKPKPTKNLVI